MPERTSLFDSETLRGLLASTQYKQELKTGLSELGCFTDQETGFSTLKPLFSHIDTGFAQIEANIIHPNTAQQELKGLQTGIELLELLDKKITNILKFFERQQYIHRSNTPSTKAQQMQAERDRFIRQLSTEEHPSPPRLEDIARRGGMLLPISENEWVDKHGDTFPDPDAIRLLSGVMELQYQITVQIKTWKGRLGDAAEKEGRVKQYCPNVLDNHQPNQDE